MLGENPVFVANANFETQLSTFLFEVFPVFPSCIGWAVVTSCYIEARKLLKLFYRWAYVLPYLDEGRSSDLDFKFWVLSGF